MDKYIIKNNWLIFENYILNIKNISSVVLETKNCSLNTRSKINDYITDFITEYYALIYMNGELKYYSI